MTDKLVYEFNGVRVDTARRLLTRHGAAVSMFPRCFDALTLLLERRGELLGKEFLLNALWPDVVVDENSLAKVISEVRRALGEGPKDPGCIVTVPRRGYRFMADVTVQPTTTGEPVGGGATTEIRALAVLPFTFLNPVAGDEWLGVGLADALITRLGQLRRTLVRPTSSVAGFASNPCTPATAGAQLAVDAVIAGSIRRVDGTVRVGVQLVSVVGEAVLWADRFDAAPASALELEDSLADRVATALTLALSREERPPSGQRLVANPDAYEQFIRGRYLATKRTRGALLEAAQCFERATAIDPEFALAHVGLSEVWIHMGIRAAVSQSLPPREVMPKALAAARQALALDDSLSEAHATLGHVLFVYEWQRQAGLAELARAIELNPNNPNAHHWYAMSLASLGRFEEALVQIRSAQAIEPLAVMVNANIGFILYRAGRIDEAIAKLRHTVAMEPGFAMSRYRLGLALEARGMFEEALEEFRAMQPSSADPLGLTGMARTLALMGREAQAREMLDTLREIARSTHVPAATLADVYAALGDHDRAFECLNRAIDERAIAAIWLRHERHWEPLRGDPRFAALTARVAL